MGKVAANVTSRRRGCNEASVVYVNPSVNPPHGVLPAPRPGSLFDNSKKSIAPLFGAMPKKDIKSLVTLN